jgi:hypothetical protein
MDIKNVNEFDITTFEGRLERLIYLLQNFNLLSEDNRAEVQVLMVDVKAEMILNPVKAVEVLSQ